MLRKLSAATSAATFAWTGIGATTTAAGLTTGTASAASPRLANLWQWLSVVWIFALGVVGHINNFTYTVDFRYNVRFYALFQSNT